MAKIPTLPISCVRNNTQKSLKNNRNRKQDFIPSPELHGPQQGCGSPFDGPFGLPGPSHYPLGSTNGPPFGQYYGPPRPFFPSPGPFFGPHAPHNVMSQPFCGHPGPPPGPPISAYGPPNYCGPPGPFCGPPGAPYGAPGPNQQFCRPPCPPQGLPQATFGPPALISGSSGQLPGPSQPFHGYPQPVCGPPVSLSGPAQPTAHQPQMKSDKEKETKLKKPPICGKVMREIKTYLRHAATMGNKVTHWNNYDKQLRKLAEMSKLGTLFEKWNDDDIEEYHDLYYICNKIYKKWLNDEYDLSDSETVLPIPQTDLERLQRMKKTLRPPSKSSKKRSWDEYAKQSKQLDVLYRIAIHPQEWKGEGGEETDTNMLVIDKKLVAVIKTKLRLHPNKTNKKPDWDEYSKQCMALSAWLKKATESPEWKDRVIIEHNEDVCKYETSPNVIVCTSGTSANVIVCTSGTSANVIKPRVKGEGTSESAKQASQQQQEEKLVKKRDSPSSDTNKKRPAIKRTHAVRDSNLSEQCNGQVQSPKKSKLTSDAASDAGPSAPKQKKVEKLQDPSVQRRVESVVHAAQCQDTACSLTSCLRIRQLTKHAEACKRKVEGGCTPCKALVKLRIYHSKYCQESSCPLPFCPKLKNKLGIPPSPQPAIEIKPSSKAPPPKAVKQQKDLPKSTVKASHEGDHKETSKSSAQRIPLREVKKKLQKEAIKTQKAADQKDCDKQCKLLETLYKTASDYQNCKDKVMKRRKSSQCSADEKRLINRIKDSLFHAASVTKTRADWDEYERQYKQLNEWLKIYAPSEDWKAQETEDIKPCLWAVDRGMIERIKAKLLQVANRTKRKADLEEYEKRKKQLDKWLWKARLAQVQKEQEIEGNKNFYNICIKVFRGKLDSLYDQPKKKRTCDAVRRILQLRRIKKWMEEQYKSFPLSVSSTKQQLEASKKVLQGTTLNDEGVRNSSKSDVNKQAEKDYHGELDDVSEESLEASECSSKQKVEETESVTPGTALGEESDRNLPPPPESEANEQAEVGNEGDLESVSEENLPPSESDTNEQAEVGNEGYLETVSEENLPPSESDANEQAEVDNEGDLETVSEGDLPPSESDVNEQAEVGNEGDLETVSEENSSQSEQAEDDEEMSEDPCAEIFHPPTADNLQPAEDDERPVEEEPSEEKSVGDSLPLTTDNHQPAEDDRMTVEEQSPEEKPLGDSLPLTTDNHQPAKADRTTVEEQSPEEKPLGDSLPVTTDNHQPAEADRTTVEEQSPEEKPLGESSPPPTDKQQPAEEVEIIVKEKSSEERTVGTVHSLEGDDEAGPPAKVAKLDHIEDNTSLEDQKQNKPEKTQEPSVQQRVQAVVHAAFCKDATCIFPSCLKMKQLVKHAKNCKRKVEGGCTTCKSLAKFRIYHSKYCEVDNCPLPFCFTLKKKLGIQPSIETKTAAKNCPDDAENATETTSKCRAGQSAA